MVQDRAVEPLQRFGRGPCFRFAARILVGLACSALPATGAVAQVDARPSLPSANRPSVCDVRADDTAELALNGAKPVFANCGGHGVMLGHANDFRVFRQEALQAVLVDMRRDQERRVLLVSLQPDGTPLLEDISGQISMAAGRGPLSSLEGVEIDLSGFAREGLVGVRGGPDESGASARTSAIELGRQLAELRSIRGSRSSED